MAEPPRKSSSDSPSEGDATATPESTVSTTELRRLNEELRRLNAELYRGERGFRTLADNVPALFSYIDAEQRYRYVNRRYRKLWNRPAEEIIGTTVAELLGPEG